MLEKAVFIANANQLKYADSRYARLYFGNEFCQKLLATNDDIKKVIRFCRKRHFALTFVTPYVTDAGIKRIRLLLDTLKSDYGSCEIVVNDWGVLGLVNGEYPVFRPVLGRLLTKQNRDPRVGRLNKQPGTTAEYSEADQTYTIKSPNADAGALIRVYKETILTVPRMAYFLIKERIGRVEFDNVLQGIGLRLPDRRLKASLYVPFVYVTTTRLCSANPYQERKPFECKISRCKKDCQKYTLRICHRGLDRPLFQKGNTLFYRNAHVAPVRDLAKQGFDRIVYQPVVPM